MKSLSSWRFKSLLKKILGVRLGRLHQYSPRTLSVSSIKRNGNDIHVPRISLVTPSLNQGRFVGETIRSVIEQAYPNLEYVVQDACSTDGTADILHGFIGEGVDLRIEPDTGQADALNKGFSRTTGEVMGYLNSDDLLVPGCLGTVARYFNDNPDVDVIYGNRLIVDENGHEIGRWILPGHDSRVLRFVDYVPQECMFWRRRIWDRVGADFDENLHFALDWDLILRFMDAGAVFAHLPELFGIFRVHGEQKTQAYYLERGAREMAELRARYADDAGVLQSLVLHWKYLAAHRRQDAIFASKLSNGAGTTWLIQ